MPTKGGTGDLVVKFDVLFPTNLTNNQEEQVGQALP